MSIEDSPAPKKGAMPPVQPPIILPAPPAPRGEMPWWVLPGLALCVLVIFTVALCASIKIKGDMMTTMFQAAINLTMMALGYFFGSSAGSAKKDETIAANSAALANSAPVNPTTQS